MGAINAGIAPSFAAGIASVTLQRELDILARRGGGTLRIDRDQTGGLLVVRGSNIAIEGAGHTLRDCRIVIAPSARQIRIRDLTLLETRVNPASYLLDVSGNDCRFDGLTLEKRPMTGGYQGYLRAESRNCRFTGLKLTGSNGLFVAGHDHSFENFDFTSTMRRDMGGDDAFAIKGAGSTTRNIDIRNGVVRGFAAAVSIGSEVGSNAEFPQPGIVNGVTVDNVLADRCQMLAFVKPGALIYDWQHGRVENVRLSRMRLVDRGAFLFTRGIVISAGRGAIVRGFRARDITIEARAHSQGVMPTAAVDINIRADRPAARIEDIDLALTFDGSGQAGYPVDHIVRVEKDRPKLGTMRNISIDVSGSYARIAGFHIGPGLDDAIAIRRARLSHIGLSPPSSLGAAGIWADSRYRRENIVFDNLRVPAYRGRENQTSIDD